MFSESAILKASILTLTVSFLAISSVYAAASDQEAISKGTKLMASGKLDDAVTEFNNAKTLNPKSATAYWGLGVCAFSKGQVDEGLTLLNTAIEMDPSQAGFYENRAVAYATKKDYVKAWIDVEMAKKLGRELNPNFIKGLQQATIGESGLAINHGMKLMQSQKLDDAIAEFNKAKTLDPQNATAYWGLGICASAKGQVDESINLLNRAVELDPSQGGFYENRAVAHAAKKDYAKALADVEMAKKLGRQLNPDFVKGLQAASKQAPQQPPVKEKVKA